MDKFKRDAILALYPSVTTIHDDERAFSGEYGSYEEVTYSSSDVEAKAAELQSAYNAKQYQRERQYPSIQEQLDMLYWDGINGTTNWSDAIAAVKEANPKPE